MKTEKLPFEATRSFARIFLDYVDGKDHLKEFYNESPTVEGFKQALEKRTFPASTRSTLVNALKRQYGDLAISTAVQSNLDLLSKENTFTITTGHQLNIFTGPLYFIYKIATVVNAAKKLKETYPDYNFVPVYWMATEDHDFEEISYFHLGEKKYTWNTDQSGAVGRFNTASIKGLLDEIPEKLPFFEAAYETHDKLADACRCYVSEIFAAQGVVVVDGDDHELKSVFQPVIESEVLTPQAKDLVAATNEKLVGLGYSSQAFTRDINFFHLGADYRTRIVKNDDGSFGLIDSERIFTQGEMEAEIRDSPENFSPNVILRPLYQEIILPNLGYVGGPAEMAYWLQLKSVFEHYNVDFPILLPRCFGLYVPRNTARKIEKNQLSNEALFEPLKTLRQRALDKFGEDYSTTTAKSAFHQLWERVKEKAVSIDPTLAESTEAEKIRIEKRIDHLEGKMRKAVERKNEDALNQVDAIKSVLSPNGSLQERYHNFLTYYFENRNFVEEVLANFDPFDLRFHILWEE